MKYFEVFSFFDSGLVCLKGIIYKVFRYEIIIMYLTKVKIRNYRSIENTNLEFEKGKNIIVGKNNSGKSNIVKAINLILGESTPQWEKFQNITDNDFFKGDKSKKIIIYCELKRDKFEDLNYSEINKCFNFKVPSRVKYGKDPVPFPFNQNDDENFEENINKFFKVKEEYEIDSSKPSYWVGSKSYCKKFEEELNDKYIFGFIFEAYYENDKLRKDLCFIYKKEDADKWNLGLSAPIRNEFIQSALIPSFRDPYNQLRINNYSWYGKLLKQSIDFESPELQSSLSQVKTISDKIFLELNNELNSKKIAVAFPNTQINLQLNPENNSDIHKSTLIYVEDGFNSLIEEKGSGIQSSIIIGLFNYYIKKNHISNSLLIIEEPELYLHPQGRRVISNKLEDFLEGNKNQVIITTHASEFITTTGEMVNIILVKKNENQASIAKNTTFEDSKYKQLLLRKENNEMFFADKVILVEGGEKYIIEILARYYGKKNDDEFWLDNSNISVISSKGKTEFYKYYNKLKELGIEVYIVGDFDFLIRNLSEFMTKTSLDSDLKSKLDELKCKIGSKKSINKIKIKTDIPIEFLEQINETILNLFEKNIFILSGELESFYLEKMNNEVPNGLGKEERPIKLVFSHIDKPEEILNYINSEEYLKVIEFIFENK